MEPSRQTAGRRRRALLALSRQLDAEYGPDESEIVYTLPDGWTIREMHRLEDQRREGQLMRNCLAGPLAIDDNCFSLRDADNLPHISFSAWEIDADDDLSDIPDTVHGFCGGKMTFLRAPRGLLMVDTSRAPLKPEHEARLLDFAGSDAIGAVPALPRSPEGRMRALLNAILTDISTRAGMGLV